MTDFIHTYDYSFLKKLNKTFYTDFNDLVEAYLSNIQASIFQIANGLFEKGFKYFLDKEGKLDLFFDEDPTLTKMVLSSKYPESRAYIRNRISIDYDILVYVRDSANSKKHDLSEDNPVLHKAVIITELFSLFVQLHNFYYSIAVEMPSKEYIEYISSFSEYKDHKLEDIDKEIQTRLEKADFEVKSKLKSAEEKLTEKQNQILAADSKLSEVQTEIERTGSLLSEANEKISAVEDLLKEKTQEVKELDDYLTKRKAEIVLTESSRADNDLYELANSFLSSGDFDSALRVFKNIQNSNIRDLRAYFGVILCLFKARNLDELIVIAVKDKRQLKNEPIYEDLKFLKENDKQFIIGISNKINGEILFNQLQELVANEQFEKALSVIQELKDLNVPYDLSLIENKINEPLYLTAVKYFSLRCFDYSIKLFTNLKDYKDSRVFLDKAIFERNRVIEANNNPTIENYNKDDFEIVGTTLKRYIKSYKNDYKANIIIPKGITVIGDEAFAHTTNLKNVIIPNSVKIIGRRAFYNCRRLTKIILPDSINTIGAEAFGECVDLTELVTSNGVKSIGEGAFYFCINLTKITLPKSLKTIANSIFYGCVSLTEITLGDKITNIGDFAFNNCQRLTTIKLPDSVKSIGYCAFKWCTLLSSIVIPQNVVSIEEKAFASCEQLAKVTIQSNILKIDNYVFSECKSLSSIKYNGTIEQWNEITKGVDYYKTHYKKRDHYDISLCMDIYKSYIEDHTGNFIIYCIDGTISK